MNTKQQPPLPTLQPGDSHMESLIEAAIQGHASTRDAMRWLVRQLVPHPSMATQAEVTDSMIREAFLANGFTIKDGHSDLKPYVYAAARAILALRPEQVPMTDEEATAMIRETVRGNTIRREGSTSLQIVRATEAYYGITAQAKKESA